ncbi:hypothetical protein GGR52DRAFT_566992 [Hypoxylon sp. FL1284]|nr:hypothetical protein GGR52DRAFT_566992 [Hypoxylon sp. FL1284]
MLLSTAVLFPILLTLAEAQRHFIDEVPAYKDLPVCAEIPVSLIVRDMASGCGDNSQTTSYSCFCTASSSKMDHILSTAVASRCSTGPVSAPSVALDVFASYCDLGKANKTSSANATQTTATVTQTLTPSASSTLPAPTALTPIPSNVASGPHDRTIPFLCSAMAVAAALGATIA